MREDTGRWGGVEHAACQAVSEHTHVHTQDMTQTHKHVQTTRHGTPNRANSPSCSYTHTHTHTSQPSPIPHTRINEASRPPHPPPSPQAHLAASWALRGCFLYFHSCAPHLPGDFAQMPPSPQASRPPHPPPSPNPAESMTLLHWAFPPRHGASSTSPCPEDPPTPTASHPQGSTSPWNRHAQSRPNTAQHRVGGDMGPLS